MLYKYTVYLLLLATVLSACKSSAKLSQPEAATVVPLAHKSSLQATMLTSKEYTDIPSASGIEKVGNRYYMLGDDSPYLYQLDSQFKLTKKYTLFDAGPAKAGRIAKATKPDLESICQFTYGRDTLLVLLGSGSSSARNKGFLVNASEKHQVTPLDLSLLYTFLKRVLKIESEGVLNIEGLAMDNSYAYFLQRPFGGKPSVLFRFDANDFKDFLLRGGPLPAVAVYHFTLPALNGVPSGFSGAYTLGDKLFFTASAEDTPDAIQDGRVMGSYIGVIYLRDLPYATNPYSPLAVPASLIQNVSGQPFTGKAESVVVVEVEKDKKYKAVVVTDDDEGSSGLYEIELSLTQDN